jgi:excisionase family DNA binding protein
VPTESPDPPAVLDLVEAAAYLRLNPEALRRMLVRGEIPGAKLGGRWRISRDQLIAVLAGGER